MYASELDGLMEQINSRYTVETVPVRIGGKTLKILQLKNFDEYLEDLIECKGVGMMELPFWAKVWDASLLLAYYVGKQPVVLGRHILEIGAGIGIVGIYAALHGHRVTMTDNNDDALLFARANALLNGVPQVEVVKLDWKQPELPTSYEMVVGSEVVYDRSTYPALVRFLLKATAPQGMIFLAKNAELHAPAFFVELTKQFEFKQTVQTVQLDDESQKIELYAIRRKSRGKNGGGV